MGEHRRMTISTSYPHSLHGVVAVALLGIGGVACAVRPPADAASTVSSASLRAPIAALIGNAPCDNQGQCHVVGIGAKACGGPSGFLAWSDKKTDPKALEAAVQAQAQAAREENKASGLASDCMMAPTPSAVCRPRASDGLKNCELGQGGASSAN
jgi:hypothetical protein